MKDDELIYPAELPCPSCPAKHSVGRYIHRDAYNCSFCGVDISGPEWARWRQSCYGKNKINQV